MASMRPSKLGMQLHFICRHTALTSIQSSNYFPNSKPCCGRSLHILSRTRLSPSTACARLSLLVCAISLGLSVLHSSPTQDMVSLIGKRSNEVGAIKNNISVFLLQEFPRFKLAVAQYPESIFFH